MIRQIRHKSIFSRPSKVSLYYLYMHMHVYIHTYIYTPEHWYTSYVNPAHHHEGADDRGKAQGGLIPTWLAGMQMELS